MAIGISTAVNTKTENWYRLKDLVAMGYKHIELYNKITRIRMVDVLPLRELKKQSKLTYSFHSMVQDLFCSDKIIAAAELGCLKGEIRLASLIGCNHLIFHISKKTALKSSEINNLKQLSSMAKKMGLELCLENNFSSGAFSGDYLNEIIQKVKHLKICLDIGHLNIAINKGLIANLDKFLLKIKRSVVQLHVSFNDGKQDQHRAPITKDLKYLKKIASFFPRNILTIIETKNIQQAVKINKPLQKYVQRQ